MDVDDLSAASARIGDLDRAFDTTKKSKPRCRGGKSSPRGYLVSPKRRCDRLLARQLRKVWACRS
jgi:hypothetical protein